MLLFKGRKERRKGGRRVLSSLKGNTRESLFLTKKKVKAIFCDFLKGVRRERAEAFRKEAQQTLHCEK